MHFMEDLSRVSIVLNAEYNTHHTKHSCNRFPFVMRLMIYEYQMAFMMNNNNKLCKKKNYKVNIFHLLPHCRYTKFEYAAFVKIHFIININIQVLIAIMHLNTGTMTYLLERIIGWKRIHFKIHGLINICVKIGAYISLNVVDIKL